MRYLVDTSVFARLPQPGVVSAFAPLVAQGQVAVCAPVKFELGYSARNAYDYEAIASRLASFATVPTTDADHQRALEVQAALVSRGHHRAPSLVDALVCSIAESRELTVLHYDADFEVIAAVTGQSQQWAVARGTAD